MLALVGCAPTAAVRDDGAVLRAVLENFCVGKTSQFSVISDAPANTYGVPKEWPLSHDYERQLQHQPVSSPAWQAGQICAKARIVPKREIDATFANDRRVPPGWEKFFETFKGAHGYHAYSRPIYSSDGKHAVIFSDWRCDQGCGMGMVTELEWTGGHWRVIRYAGTWIA